MRPAFLLYFDQTFCHVGVVKGSDVTVARSELPTNSAFDDMAESAVSLLKEQGWRGQNVVLALSSNSALPGFVPAESSTTKAKASMLLYSMEGQLPADAEKLAADFMQGDEQWFGVCVEIDRVRPLVQSLEQRGVLVRHVCPLSLLALQSLPKLDAEVVVWGQEYGLDFFILRDGLPVAWRFSAFSEHDLAIQMKVHAIQSGKRTSFYAFNIDPRWLEDFTEHPDFTLVDASMKPMLEAAAAGAAAALTGKLTPWFDLLRGPGIGGDRLRQIRTPLVASIVAAMFLLTMMAGAALWRASQYEASARDLQDRQSKLYRDLMGLAPSQRTPVGIKSRMESELQKQRALSGESNEVPVRTSSLILIHDFLASLPRNLRFQIQELRLENGEVQFAGQARTHGDANLIAAALRKNDRFQVGSPRTEQLAGKGVSFSIAARHVPAKAKTADSGTGGE